MQYKTMVNNQLIVEIIQNHEMNKVSIKFTIYALKCKQIKEKL